jgi:hypothetical protein
MWVIEVYSGGRSECGVFLSIALIACVYLGLTIENSDLFLLTLLFTSWPKEYPSMNTCRENMECLKLI